MCKKNSGGRLVLFFLLSFSLAFLLCLSCFQRQYSCMGWISDLNQHGSSRPVKPQAYSTWDRIWHSGFQKPAFFFLWTQIEKKIQKKKKKKKRRGNPRNVLFRSWGEKDVRKVLLWSLNHSTKWENFFSTFLMALPRSWKGCSEMWENSV